jgi:hypothetical protein
MHLDPWVTWTMVLVGAACLCHSDASAGRWRNTLKPEGPVSGPLTLADRGATEYVIVVPAAATSQETKAAEDLSLCLGKMTGAAFAILPDSDPPRATEISIGRTARLTRAAVPQAKANLGNEGYAIGVAGQRLFLLGGRTRGPISAVYALLEEDLGCRDSETIPHRRTLRFEPVPRTYVPRLMIRDPFYHDAFDATWSLRNRTNAPNAAVPEEWGGHVDYDGLFVHTFNTLVPPGEYFEKHPEYFMLSEGKRTPRQLCLTNLDVARIATENLLAILERSPATEIVEVSPNDGGGHCSCPNCKAVDDENGSPSGTLITFVNQIAEAVEKVRPDVMVSTLAYLDTVDAPRKVRPRHNVAVRLCNDLHSWRYPFTCFATDTQPESKRYRKAIIGWSRVCDNIHIWDYFVNFSHYSGPMPNMDVLAPSVDFYMRHHVTGIMMQAAYQGPGGEFAPLRSWVMAKLLWDPSRSVPELVDDFMLGYYREAAPEVRAYWDLLYAAKARHMDTMAAPPEGIRYPMTSPFLSRELLESATAIFADAQAKCRSQRVLHRVQLAKLPVLYTKLMQGPDVWGDEYAALLAEFDTIARRENVGYLREGGPDLDEKLKGWRDAVRVKQGVSEIKEGEVTASPLAAEWRFAPDPKDVGVSEEWFAEARDDSSWATVRTDKGTGWESQGFADYTGYGWYRQRVEAPAGPEHKHLYLYFGAVDEDAWVYVNGQSACEHTCASTGLAPEQIWLTPFCFDVRPYLRPGQASMVVVRVLNRLGMGGVYLPVHLVATDRELDAELIRALLAKG